MCIRDSPCAKAVCDFFDRWEPGKAPENPVLAPYLSEILKGGSLLFRVGGKFVHKDEEIAARWDERYREPHEDNLVGRCLVTGEKGPIARTHPSVKGVRGTQQTGASLVSFNGDSFESYGKKQSFNAPISKRAAFAYTTALNRLIADREYVQHMGDATVVYWAETGERAYSEDVYKRQVFDGEAVPGEGSGHRRRGAPGWSRSGRRGEWVR